MFRKILIGVDGDQHDRDAVALARRLATDETTLVLAHVHAGYPVTVKGNSGAYERILSENSETLLKKISDQTGIAATTSMGRASVGDGLHRLAEREEADLIVTGETRYGVIARTLIGDDTHDTISDARCPVAVAPMNYAQAGGELHAIGVGYDGSPDSRVALEFARSLAQEFHCRLDAFEVYDLHTRLGYAGLPAAELAASQGSDSSDLLAELGLEPRVTVGDPATELAVSSTEVDVLVVGAPALGHLRHLFHHSVSQQLAHVARCPLLVVPNGVSIATSGAAAESIPSPLS